VHTVTVTVFPTHPKIHKCLNDYTFSFYSSRKEQESMHEALLNSKLES